MLFGRLSKNRRGIPDGGALRGESYISGSELVHVVGVVVVHSSQAEGVLVAEQRLQGNIQCNEIAKLFKSL